MRLCIIFTSKSQCFVDEYGFLFFFFWVHYTLSRRRTYDWFQCLFPL